MPNFIQVPITSLDAEVFQALLEEFVSRDGTDYGFHEQRLDQKVDQLRQQLVNGDSCLMFETDAEEWDIVSKETATMLLTTDM